MDDNQIYEATNEAVRVSTHSVGPSWGDLSEATGEDTLSAVQRYTWFYTRFATDAPAWRSTIGALELGRR